jgi:hypothetical protein
MTISMAYQIATYNSQGTTIIIQERKNPVCEETMRQLGVPVQS